MEKNKIQLHWRNFLIILFNIFILGFLLGFLVWYQADEEKTVIKNAKARNVLEEKNDSGRVLPRLIRQIEPVYPARARKANIQGKVILEARINKYGRVEEVKVLSSFDPLLDISAQEALRQWVYEPMKVDNKPQKFVTMVTFYFKLNKNKRKYPLLGII